MQVNIKNLIDDAQCYQTVRELRWLGGVKCPSCESPRVIKRGFDDTEPDRQRYECHGCKVLLHKSPAPRTTPLIAGFSGPDRTAADPIPASD